MIGRVLLWLPSSIGVAVTLIAVLSFAAVLAEDPDPRSDSRTAPISRFGRPDHGGSGAGARSPGDPAISRVLSA